MPKASPSSSAHDVARVAGVSQAAVSRAFTPGAAISAATRAKVFEAAKILDYHPNLMARSLIKGKSSIVGVVIGNHRYPFFLVALHALSARLSHAGKHILVATADGHDTVDLHVEKLLNYRADAILLMGASISAQSAERCREKGVSVISFNRPERKMPGFSSVTGDHIAGSAKIAAHLLQQGYRRLAVIGGRPGTSATIDRETGFNSYLASQGLPAPECVVGSFEREGGFEAARALLSRKQRPDAIFCANDDMALATIEAARYEFGLEIGREIGIAGFDDIEQASWPSFSLTTYSLPVDLVVEDVTKFLLDAEVAKPARHSIVEGELKIRRSTQRD